MRRIWVLAIKELACFFYSPIAYILLFLALLASGYWFYIILHGLQEALQGDITSLIPNFYGTGGFVFWLVVVLLTPPITMRLFAEEKRSGTLESLLTAPITHVEAVLGKYLGALLFYACLLLPSLLLFALVYFLGGGIEPGYLISGFMGFFLSGALFLSFGLLCSAISSNQIISASIALIANFVFVFGSGLVWPLIPNETVREELRRLDFFQMMADSLQIGILDTSHLIYFFSIIIFFLFLTTRVVEARRWL